MRICLALILLISYSSATGAELCRGSVNDIVEDMRVQENDLTREEAMRASATLHRLVKQDRFEGEDQFSALNSMKTVKGYLLRRQALTDRSKMGVKSVEAQESRQAFCTWLTSEGFWHD